MFFVAKEAKPGTTCLLHLPKEIQKIRHNCVKKKRFSFIKKRLFLNFVNDERNLTIYSDNRTRNIQNIRETVEEEFACQSI